MYIHIFISYFPLYYLSESLLRQKTINWIFYFNLNVFKLEEKNQNNFYIYNAMHRSEFSFLWQGMGVGV